MVLVIAGPSPGSSDIARSIANSLDADLLEVNSKTFPDGERYIRIPTDKIEDNVLIVQTMSQPQNTSIIEALLLADAVSELGASGVGLIAPYMAYSRQDKIFLTGEPISIRVILKSLHSAGYRSLYTIEIHKNESLRWFPGEAYSISPYEYMADRISLPGKVLVLAPDIGALDRARRLAGKLGADYDYLVKHRDRVTGEVKMEPKNIPVKGRTVLIVDDIVSTGGTLAKATKLLYDQGAENVMALVAHALLAGDAVRKLEDAGLVKLYAGNTLPPRNAKFIEYIDLGPLIAEALENS